MERSISASEANQSFSRMLRDVAAGDSFVVLSRGRPVARVAPVTEGGEQSAAMPALLKFLRTKPRVVLTGWTRGDLYE